MTKTHLLRFCNETPTQWGKKKNKKSFCCKRKKGLIFKNFFFIEFYFFPILGLPLSCGVVFHIFFVIGDHTEAKIFPSGEQEHHFSWTKAASTSLGWVTDYPRISNFNKPQIELKIKITFFSTLSPSPLSQPQPLSPNLQIFLHHHTTLPRPLDLFPTPPQKTKKKKQNRSHPMIPPNPVCRGVFWIFLHPDKGAGLVRVQVF